MDATNVERVGSVVPKLPSHWNTYAVDLWWTNASTGTGDVVWRYDYQAVGDADTLSTLTTGTTATVTAPANNVLKVTTLETGLAVPTAGKALSLTILRNASAAGDTLANDASIYMVHLRRAS